MCSGILNKKAYNPVPSWFYCPKDERCGYPKKPKKVPVVIEVSFDEDDELPAPAVVRPIPAKPTRQMPDPDQLSISFAPVKKLGPSLAPVVPLKAAPTPNLAPKIKPMMAPVKANPLAPVFIKKEGTT